MTGFSNGTADGEGSPVGLPGERHRVLAMDRRRLAIEILTDETPPTDLEALTTELVAREREHGAIDVASVKHVRATFHHVHLPKLAEVGVIDYDPETRRIDPDTAFLDTYRLR